MGFIPVFPQRKGRQFGPKQILKPKTSRYRVLHSNPCLLCLLNLKYSVKQHINKQGIKILKTIFQTISTHLSRFIGLFHRLWKNKAKLLFDLYMVIFFNFIGDLQIKFEIIANYTSYIVCTNSFKCACDGSFVSYRVTLKSIPGINQY